MPASDVARCFALVPCAGVGERARLPEQLLAARLHRLHVGRVRHVLQVDEHVPQAAAHARDPKHVALTHGAHAWQVVALCRGISPEPAPETPGDPWRTMWECGMHPDEVDRISMEIDAVEPLPVQFYLGMMARNPNLAWIRDTKRAVPLEPRSITYLAWSYGKADHADPTMRARWLRTGIMDRLALRLMHSPYDIADVEAFAAHWAISPVMAGVELTKWFDSGVAPPVSVLTAPGLEHLAYPPTPPSWQTRERLRDELDGTGPYTEEELAMALVRWGSVARAAEGLAGIHANAG